MSWRRNKTARASFYVETLDVKIIHFNVYASDVMHSDVLQASTEQIKHDTDYDAIPQDY